MDGAVAVTPVLPLQSRPPPSKDEAVAVTPTWPPLPSLPSQPPLPNQPDNIDSDDRRSFVLPTSTAPAGLMGAPSTSCSPGRTPISLASQDAPTEMFEDVWLKAVDEHAGVMAEMQELERIHKQLGNDAKGKFFKFAFGPQSLCAALTTTLAVALVESHVKTVTLATLGAASGMLAGIAGFWNWQGNGERHLSAAKGFQSIYMKFRELDLKLKFSNGHFASDQQMQQFMDEMKSLNTDASKCRNEAPHMSQELSTELDNKIKDATQNSRQKFVDVLKAEARAEQELAEEQQRVAEKATEVAQREAKEANKLVKETMAKCNEEKAKCDEQIAEWKGTILKLMNACQLQLDEVKAQRDQLERDQMAQKDKMERDQQASQEACQKQLDDAKDLRKQQLQGIHAQREQVDREQQTLQKQREELEAQKQAFSSAKQELEAQVQGLESWKRKHHHAMEDLNTVRDELKQEREAHSKAVADRKAKEDELERARKRERDLKDDRDRMINELGQARKSKYALQESTASTELHGASLSLSETDRAVAKRQIGEHREHTEPRTEARSERSPQP